ncbi:general amidase [Metarhizium album ARSEF 1941]|uniref:General amidase n=1 Tax=Metarhizium album (strain ARSEF 1941) TaxID=1081103 RepID=A0A0B2WVH8_METAS|nr:general amidase [Metarhizium album ARSEF 1941]KHN96905.1 general amidase [Metarhizium album ARSEF 1941]
MTSWEAKAAAKRASTIAKIPPAWRLSTADLQRAKDERNLTGPFIRGFLTDSVNTITAKDSLQLVESLRRGHLTAVEVTTAFCNTAAVAHQINNCLHEIFFDEAIERAKHLDAYFAQHKTVLGPLHGLPISLKDQFHVKGVDTTMGYVGWIDSNLGITDPSQIHKLESQIVTELLSLGAVLYCKTSVPQTLLFGETKNNIIGQTLNPHNHNLSCGGSSGGEGALQALGGSTLGVGTDIGGSVRIPASFNGIFSIKPTPERVSYRNSANTNPGQNTYRSAVGFLSTSLGGLELILKGILSTKPWLKDPAVVPIPFRQALFDEYVSRAEPNGSVTHSKQSLKLGVLRTDGVVQPHPPVTRGLNVVVAALQQAGHLVVDWRPPPQRTAERVHLSFLKADGAHDIHSHLGLSGEPLIPELQESFRLKPPMGLLEYQHNTLEGLAYEAKYSDYWNQTASDDGQIVDAVIMPVAPHAAVIPGKYYHTAYTEAINLLNYSAVVIPVTKADRALDAIDSDYRPKNEIDQRNWDAYDPEIYHGAPVGVQLVARKFEEEKILAIAKIVFAALEEARNRKDD